MWKYVTRRIRDSFERSVNHFDKRSSTGVVNSPSGLSEEKDKRVASPCSWFASRKCWNSYKDDNDAKSKRFNFEHLNRTWIGAITWSSALLLGCVYHSQLLHLKLKCTKENSKKYTSCLLTTLHPYVQFINKNANALNPIWNIDDSPKPILSPIVHLVTNEQNGVKIERAAGGSVSSSGTDSSRDDLGEVLNSIENRLGLAAIENGQHQDGLNLLRSAANRNHPPALYNLGLCYENGLGVTIDEKMAMELYRSAAALQHPGALYNLGIYYGQGRGGLTQDTVTATRLLRLAAVQGQQDAIDALKTLDLETTEPQRDNTGNWMEQHLPYAQSHNIVPTQSVLFVDNANTLHSEAFNYESVVY
ncbi:uncharacterized protein [Epargyreus clarus]|uniref:uncharacterized protein n=1 Tax=Epargyreus clarus TaxID=520877 RepID=UPI003C2D38BD